MNSSLSSLKFSHFMTVENNKYISLEMNSERASPLTASFDDWLFQFEISALNTNWGKISKGRGYTIICMLKKHCKGGMLTLLKQSGNHPGFCLHIFVFLICISMLDYSPFGKINISEMR